MTTAEKRIAKETFLRALSNTANVRAVCLAANMDGSTVYRWQEVDEEFAQLRRSLPFSLLAFLFSHASHCSGLFG